MQFDNLTSSLNSKLLFLKRYIICLFIKSWIPLVSGFLLLLITFILPYSGKGEEIQLASWDQSLFLSSLQEALSGKSPFGVNEALVGPGYVALGVIATKLLGSKPDFALVALNRFSFLSTVLVFFIISQFLLRKVLSESRTSKTEICDRSTSNLCNIISFTYTLTLVLSANFVSFSDIPWTHFPATLLTLICLLSILYSIKEFKKKNWVKYVWFSVFGSALGLLIQVRFFEGAIFSIALFVWLFLLLIKTIKSCFKWILSLLKAVLIAGFFFTLTSYLSLILSNTKKFHLLYFTLGENNPSIREITKIYIDIFLVKFVQLFIDPNFFTINQSYEIKPIIFGFEFSSWKMPLLLQIPALLYILPFMVIILSLIIFKKDIPLLLSAEIFLPLLVGTGLILGYVASAASGSPHLKYGFVRDFMAPTWCLAAIANPGIFYRYIGLPTAYMRKLFWLAIPILPIFIGMLYGQVLIKSTSFFQFKSYHVQTINLTPSCNGLKCSVSIKMQNSKSRVIEAPKERYIIIGSCPPTGETLAVTLASQNQRFTLPSCSESYPVQVFPANMGFAGTSELPPALLFKPPQ